MTKRLSTFVPAVLLVLFISAGAPAASYARGPSNLPRVERDSVWNGVLIGAVVGMAIAPPAYCGRSDASISRPSGRRVTRKRTFLAGGHAQHHEHDRLIMLMGLVTKNAILLVDFTNQARAQGLPRHRLLPLQI